MSGKETEAKFLVRNSAAARTIRRLRQLGPFHLRGRFRQRQTNIYLDTEDLRLRRARVALKLRKVGRHVEGTSQRWRVVRSPLAEATFKSELAFRKGVSERLEVTVPVKSRDLSRFLKGTLDCKPIRRARRIVGDRPLLPVLTLRTDRRGWLFAAGREKVELVLDRVRVERRGHRFGVHVEIEMENRGAREDRFRQALAALKSVLRGSIRSSRISKYEIGLRMAKGRLRG